jgi:hypothetical protein
MIVHANEIRLCVIIVIFLGNIVDFSTATYYVTYKVLFQNFYFVIVVSCILTHTLHSNIQRYIAPNMMVTVVVR